MLQGFKEFITRGNAIETAAWMKEQGRETPVVIMTAFGSMEAAIAATNPPGPRVTPAQIEAVLREAGIREVLVLDHRFCVVGGVLEHQPAGMVCFC